jgi:hypothetical protein
MKIRDLCASLVRRPLTIAAVLATAFLCFGSSGYAQWLMNGTTAYYNGGRVGIGVASPAFQFQVLDSNPAGQGIGAFQNTNGILYMGIDPTGGYLQSGTGVNFSFWAGPNRVLFGSATTGRVGIGTSSPAALLHVAGNALFDGTVTGMNIQANYQDIAEWVPAAAELIAGTVVAIDPAATNHVIASSRAYDTTVAGVISTRPGLILGEAGANKEMVATTGRVKVRVDASTQPIRIGDLLVSSDMPGIAMKSQPVLVSGIEMHRPGTIIGKALEPLPSGRGEILVLLSLQ